jgi:parvulin-like peptidyl-prolyl isomerase
MRKCVSLPIHQDQSFFIAKSVSSTKGATDTSLGRRPRFGRCLTVRGLKARNIGRAFSPFHLLRSRPGAGIGRTVGAQVARIASVIFIATLVCVISRDTLAEEQPPKISSVIAATAQGRQIPLTQLERELAVVVKDRKLSADAKTALQKQVLQHAVDRRLVMHWLVTTNEAASPQDVELLMGRLQKKLDNEGIKLADFLRQQGQTEGQFRDQQWWELSWQKYLDKHLTAATLQKYFDKNRRDFDGTELRVAHILLPATTGAKADDIAKLKMQAAAIRDDIVAKKLTFADAAKQHSKSPTAAKGGDIGWIQRHEPMPESFSTAAFELQADEVSQPVETAFGVHLIQCLEVKSGQRTWQDAAEELRPAVIHYLFRWIADKERPAAKIEYTTHWPH